MSISINRSQKNYTAISNELLQDARLSLAARGLACYLLSHDRPTVDVVVCPGDAIALSKELAAAGYLVGSGLDYVLSDRRTEDA